MDRARLELAQASFWGSFCKTPGKMGLKRKRLQAAMEAHEKKRQIVAHCAGGCTADCGKQAL